MTQDNVRFLPDPDADHEGTQVALTSGHVARVYLVGPDGQRGTWLPQRFRKAAIAVGCGIVGVEEFQETVQAPNDKHSLIVGAIERLIDADDAETLEGNGRPKLANLKKESGVNITKSEADAAWATFVESLDEGTKG